MTSVLKKGLALIKRLTTRKVNLDKVEREVTAKTYEEEGHRPPNRPRFKLGRAKDA